jgi:hypothetical protein
MLRLWAVTALQAAAILLYRWADAIGGLHPSRSGPPELSAS